MANRDELAVVSEALVAFDGLVAGGRSEAERSALLARVGAALQEWEQSPLRWPADCPLCGALGALARLSPWLHFERCALHPVRLDAEETIACARALAAEADAGPVFDSAPSAQERARQDLRLSSPASWFAVGGSSAEELALALSEWALLRRGRGTCTWCRNELPVDELVSHASTCAAHPATRHLEGPRTAVASAPEEARSRAEAIAFERLAQHELGALLRACDAYSDSMGWDGDMAYTKKWSEFPWRSAYAATERRLVWLESAAAKRRTGGTTPWSSRAAELLAATRLLVRACSVFWNSMRDGERGKSLISEEIEQRWNAERRAASSVLKAAG